MQIKNYGYERCVCDINALEKSYGIKKGSIGKTHENREILYFRIGSGEKKLLFVGAHHAREYVSSYFLMDYASTGMVLYFAVFFRYRASAPAANRTPTTQAMGW